MGPEKGKLEIDTLRGIAVIAVVWAHCEIHMAESLHSMAEPGSVVHTWVDGLARILAPLRMPLFTILSGWVYALKPVSAGNAAVFLGKKARRLLIPMVLVALLHYVLAYWLSEGKPVLPSTGEGVEPHEVWKLWFFRFGHLWFIQALFAIFVGVLIIDSMGWMNSLRSWGLWLAALAVLPYLIGNSPFWSADRTKHLAVFFFFGVGLYRFRRELLHPKVLRIAWVVFAVSMVFYVSREFGSTSFPHLRPVLVVAGTAGSVCLLSLNLQIPLLAWLGSYSYTIYLYHGLALESNRLFQGLLRFGVVEQLLWFTLLMVLTLGSPILLDYLVRQSRWLSTILLGRTPKSPARVNPPSTASDAVLHASPLEARLENAGTTATQPHLLKTVLRVTEVRMLDPRVLLATLMTFLLVAPFTVLFSTRVTGLFQFGLVIGSYWIWLRVAAALDARQSDPHRPALPGMLSNSRGSRSQLSEGAPEQPGLR